MAVFLLTEDFSLVPGLLVGAPVVAAIIMRLPVVAAALLKKSFKKILDKKLAIAVAGAIYRSLYIKIKGTTSWAVWDG